MSKVFFIVGLLIFMFLLQAKGQQAWTLEQCIDYSVRHNLDLVKVKLQNEISRETYHQSIRNLLPSAGLSAGGGIYFGKSVDPTTYDFIDKQFYSTSYSLGASIDLFNGFAKINTISYNKLSYLAGEEDSKRQKNEIAFKAMDAYFNVQFYKGLLEIANKQKELSELNLKRAKTRHTAGLNSKSDLVEMESKLAAEELTLVQTRNNLNAALLSLKQIMNYNEPEGLATEDYQVLNMIEGENSPGIETVYGQALNQNPLIKAVEFQKSAARKYLSATRGKLFPSLSLSGGYSTNYAKARGDNNTMNLRDQFKGNASQSISLSLDVPIFYNWGLQSNVKKAKLQLLQAQTEYDITKQQLYQEIEKNFNELSALSAEYSQTLKQCEFSGFAYEAAERKLEQGLIDILDFYENKNMLAQAESNVLRTKLQYELKKRTIDFFIGKPIYSEK